MTDAAALRAILGLRLRAARNQLAGLIVSGKQPAGSRRASPASLGSAAGVFFGLMALFLAFAMSRALVDSAASYAVASGRVARVMASQAAYSRACAEALSFYLGWALLVLVCLGLGFRDPHRLGARLESLLSLPVKLRVAFAAEIVERALNPFLWLTVFPLLTATAWSCGFRSWTSPLPALLLTPLHGITVGALEFAIAIGVRQRVAAEHAGKVRALALAAGVVSPVALQAFLIGLINARLNHTDGGALGRVIDAVGGIALLSPAGTGLLAIQGARGAALAAATALATTCAVWAAALVLMERLSDRGLELLQARSDRLRRKTLGARLFDVLPAGLAEELIGLSRDLPALTINVLGPIVMVVAHVFILPRQEDAPGADTIALLVAGLIVGAAIATLPRMGRSVWVLFTLPRRLETLALERAATWGVLGLTAGLVTLASLQPGGLLAPGARPALWSLLVGVPTLTLACAAIGVLGARPLATDRHERMGQEAGVNQLLLIVALAASAVLPDLSTRVRLLIFLAVIAGGLWQRAALFAPRLLDPAVGTPRPIDTADGMKAVLAFTTLTPLLAFCSREIHWAREPAGRPWTILIVFLLSGGMALGLTVDPLVKQGLKLRDVIPLARGPRSLLFVAGGALGGLLTFGLGLGYAAVLQWQFGSALPPQFAPRHLVEVVGHPAVRYLMPVIVAPVIEEIVFRGLLYVGMRQALGSNWALLLSSLVFASIHTEYGFGVIFALAAACAWIYERTGLLSPAMALHAVHNLVGVTFSTRLTG